MKCFCTFLAFTLDQYRQYSCIAIVSCWPKHFQTFKNIFFFADTEYAGSIYVQYWSLYKNTRTLRTYPIKEFGFICNLSKVFNYSRKKEVTEFYSKETNTFDLKRKTVPFLFKTSRIPLISFSLFRCEDYILLIICLTLNTSLLIHVTVPKSSSSTLRNFILRF